MDTPSPRPENQAELCALCGELPDDLTVNTGRGECFPAAFDRLTPVGIPSPSQGQWVGSQFRRCPNCGAFFDWGDAPQMYGSGNCDEERLVRLPATASRLLNNLFPPDPKAPPDPGKVGVYFEDLPLDLLLRALSSQVSAAPRIVTPFVPGLARLLGVSQDAGIARLLGAYLARIPEPAEEIEAAQARYAQIILGKHVARAGLALRNDGLPANWPSFGVLFRDTLAAFAEQGAPSPMMKKLLAELVEFIRAFSENRPSDKLTELIGESRPLSAWLGPYVPVPARADKGDSGDGQPGQAEPPR